MPLDDSRPRQRSKGICSVHFFGAASGAALYGHLPNAAEHHSSGDRVAELLVACQDSARGQLRELACDGAGIDAQIFGDLR